MLTAFEKKRYLDFLLFRLCKSPETGAEIALSDFSKQRDLVGFGTARLDERIREFRQDTPDLIKCLSYIQTGWELYFNDPLGARLHRESLETLINTQ